MNLILIGLLIIMLAITYLGRAPSPDGAQLGCVGLLLGAVIVLVAIVKLVFF